MAGNQAGYEARHFGQCVGAVRHIHHRRTCVCLTCRVWCSHAWCSSCPQHLVGWLLDLSADDCVTSGGELTSLASRWHPTVSDRYVQLVFIGGGIDRAAITARMRECCMTRQDLQRALGDPDDDDDATTTPPPAPLELLKPVVEFNPKPDAEAVCAIRQ